MIIVPDTRIIYMFGKKKKVKVAIYNPNLNTPNPKIVWIERQEDLYGIPIGVTSIVVHREDWLRGETIED